jgi:hypothetical protein
MYAGRFIMVAIAVDLVIRHFDTGVGDEPLNQLNIRVVSEYVFCRIIYTILDTTCIICEGAGHSLPSPRR